MRQLVFGAAIALSLVTPALADGNGTVSVLYVPDGVVDTRPCVFFQTNGGSQWYAVSIADGNSGTLFAAEFALLSSLRLTGLSLSFQVGSAVTACQSYPRAYDLQQ